MLAYNPIATGDRDRRVSGAHRPPQEAKAEREGTLSVFLWPPCTGVSMCPCMPTHTDTHPPTYSQKHRRTHRTL